MANRRAVAQENPVVDRHSADAGRTLEPREWTSASGVRTLVKLMRHPAEFCANVAETFPGEVVRVRTGLGSFLLASSPAHVEHILVTNEKNYWKGEMFNTLRPVFGDSLLLSEGTQWRAQRRIMQPYFRVMRLRSMSDDFERIIEKAIEGWEHGALVDVERKMRDITLCIILHAMFSSSLREQDIAEAEVELERVVRRAPIALFSWKAPAIGRLALRAPAAALDRLLFRIIKQRREANEDLDDLLGALLAARHEDGKPLDDREIRDHVVTTIFGGYEATATALHWLWLMLSRHSEVRARAYAEIDSGAKAEQLQYVQQVIDETLRLFPPFWLSGRTSHQADQIGQYAIAPGSTILFSPYALHRQSRLWPDPERFDPDRFAPGEQPVHPCAYMPFLRGPRMCIGKHLAELEMRLVAKVVGSRWLLEATDPSWKIATEARGSLRPRKPPGLRLSRR